MFHIQCFIIVRSENLWPASKPNSLITKKDLRKTYSWTRGNYPNPKTTTWWRSELWDWTEQKPSIGWVDTQFQTKYKSTSDWKLQEKSSIPPPSTSVCDLVKSCSMESPCSPEDRTHNGPGFPRLMSCPNPKTYPLSRYVFQYSGSRHSRGLADCFSDSGVGRIKIRGEGSHLCRGQWSGHSCHSNL